jgi:hypothetical protein
MTAMRVRAISSIGPCQVVAEQDQRKTFVDEIARMTIPDKDLADVTAALLSRCYQQAIWSPLLLECLDTAATVRASVENLHA